MRWLTAVIVTIWASIAVAHEVMPTIGDLTLGQKDVTLELRVNAEAFAAGIDLDGLEDTNATDRSDEYDALRALPADEMQALMAPVAQTMADNIALTQGDQALALRVTGIEIAPLGEIEYSRESTLRFQADLTGQGPVILNWPDGYGTLVLRQMGVEEGYTAYLDGGQASAPIRYEGAEARSGWGVFAEYIPVGFDHILPKGLDHILFVLGLFFLSTRLGPLLWQVTAFTAAHTVTLALGALGIVTIPGSIVEPIIAASIVYVAVENILSPKMHAWRPVVVFCFGLLHGLGFASVLGEFGLPAGQFIPALLGFNVGVELGQLTVIALAFLAVGLWFGKKPFYRPYIAVPASVVIALVGAYWFVERVFF